MLRLYAELPAGIGWHLRADGGNNEQSAGMGPLHSSRDGSGSGSGAWAAPVGRQRTSPDA